ncbi:carboxymuconolactone decarboxylase family protein [Myroides odoratimimus]|uniref:carboxymuconolactone decarboxylase family protein n=1 Tax=Myroides odoratimimus TaxID=76832 RepID=UPI002575408E|nr:carboxymuconolactone decarboxylase family protein [Myroides odoratimimus]MDM1468094.1 carboxymuconolactone decarboxylase family protein [Myroides odoratimimus]MDM1471399.1 carboxymuconolactone decarboxylase family protein [Myroides odoratimimus]MDM1481495.1 carboxymuconolactone decarboxylase family protein [Myroides odoratimimus]
MKKRIDLSNVVSSGYKRIIALDSFVQNSGLDKTHLELIKIRASQINGCAYCLNLHTRDAMNQGETAQRIFLLNAWRETELFTEEERTILAMTEEITLISERGLTEETYEMATKLFNEEYIGFIIMAIITINAWNRVAVSTHKPID